MYNNNIAPSEPVPVNSDSTKQYMDILKQYWWVIALLVAAFIYYRYQQSKTVNKNSSQEYEQE